MVLSYGEHRDNYTYKLDYLPQSNEKFPTVSIADDTLPLVGNLMKLMPFLLWKILL
jgi:hypothetical protein